MRSGSRPKVLLGNLSMVLALIAFIATPVLATIRPRFGTTLFSTVLAEYILWVALTAMVCGAIGLFQRAGRIIALAGLLLAVIELVGVPSFLIYF